MKTGKVKNYAASGFDGEKIGTCLLSVPVPTTLKEVVLERMKQDGVPSIAEWVRRLVLKEVGCGNGEAKE